jgi:hypothetical protein
MPKTKLGALTLTLVALALPLAGHSSPPTILHEPINDTFIDPACGFPLEIIAEGIAVVHLYLDEAGAFERAIITAPQTRLTFTNLWNGKSVWTPSVNTVTAVEIDADSGTSSLRGLFWHLILPGEGLIAADVGRLDLLFTRHADGSVTEEVIFSAGQQEGTFMPLLCDTLR